MKKSSYLRIKCRGIDASRLAMAMANLRQCGLLDLKVERREGDNHGKRCVHC